MVQLVIVLCLGLRCRLKVRLRKGLLRKGMDQGLLVGLVDLWQRVVDWRVRGLNLILDLLKVILIIRIDHLVVLRRVQHKLLNLKVKNAKILSKVSLSINIKEE